MMTTINAWLLGSLGYAAIAAIVALAVAAHFFSRSVSIVAWCIAVGALALVCVGKDAVIAGARADLAEQAAQHAHVLAAINARAAAASEEYRAREADMAEKIEKVTQDAQATKKAQRADLDAAHAAAGRLRADLDRYRASAHAAAHSGTAAGGATAGDAIGVLADVLARADARAGELARFADAAHAAGVACERAYDAVK